MLGTLHLNRLKRPLPVTQPRKGEKGENGEKEERGWGWGQRQLTCNSLKPVHFRRDKWPKNYKNLADLTIGLNFGFWNVFCISFLIIHRSISGYYKMTVLEGIETIT